MGYFDLQVNGYGGVDFNQDALSADDLHRACERFRADGVDGVLVTIVSEHLDRMCARLRRVVELRQSDPLVADVVAGLHIEGPFLSGLDGYRGAHPADAVHPADLEQAQRLVEAAGGLAKIVTLAPELDGGQRVIRWLVGQGIVVSAGHCNPSCEELDAALDAGLSMFTHLGNGCPMLLPRHENIVHRVLSRAERLWIGFIADGVHVEFEALRHYLQWAGIDRSFVVTDAIAPAGLGPGRYRSSRWDIQIGEELAARSPDGTHLLGSACTMKRSTTNLTDHVGLSAADAHRLLCVNPRRAIGVV
ncbi:MAG TPA: N-acetylglucosamine-6-phosphate deacetylase [Phycisphaerae bacterium]|nr:N-acetylglucosamine-6-phosphate deacetylase [Phycisphaerae bacterium]